MTDKNDLKWIRALFDGKFDIGSGYNGNNHGELLPNHPVEESQKTIIALKSIEVKTSVFDITSTAFYHYLGVFQGVWDFMNLISKQNQNAYKFMDFLMANHRNIGFISSVLCFSKQIRGQNVCNVPPKATHFIKYVNYGLQMVIIFNKSNNQLFEADNDGMFLEKIWKKEQEMTDEQKKVECSVLVFSLDATKTNVFEMSLKEIIKFIEEYQNGSHKEYERLLKYGLRKLPDIPEPDKNKPCDPRYGLLANQIFPLYRIKKILETEILLLMLKPVAEESAEIVQKKQRDLNAKFVKIKNLWDEGIRRCSKLLEGGLTLTESDLFAEFPSNQLEKMMNDLKINEKSEGQKIVMNKSDFHNLDSEMAQLLKMDIVLSADALQPFVKDHDSEERILIGFGSHQNQFKPQKTEASDMFVSPCPLECTIDDRQWICVNCGEFFKADGFQVVCSCGTTHVTNLKLDCFDPKHPKEFFSCEKLDPTSASSIASSRRSSFSIVNDGMY